MTSDAIGLFIQGERIEGVKDLKNKILGGNQKGIQKILMGFLIKQVEYIKNNLLRWRIDIYLPDFSQLLQDTQSI
ncbi:MAG: hypothetical protein Q4B28_03890 [bacterium]|nr:hypothetical protein [bacterium]